MFRPNKNSKFLHLQKKGKTPSDSLMNLDLQHAVVFSHMHAYHHFFLENWWLPLLLIPAHFMVSKHLKEKRWNTKCFQSAPWPLSAFAPSVWRLCSRLSGPRRWILADCHWNAGRNTLQPMKTVWTRPLAKISSFCAVASYFFCGGEEFPGHEPPFWHHLKFQLTLSNDDFSKVQLGFIGVAPKEAAEFWRLQTFETPTLFGPLEVF